MYNVELLTNEDYIRKRNPVNFPNIRTASFTSARIILTDQDNHMYTLRPGTVKSISIYPSEEERSE